MCGEVLRSPTLVEEWEFVLYGLGQTCPHKLAFKAELDPGVISKHIYSLVSLMLTTSKILCFIETNCSNLVKSTN